MSAAIAVHAAEHIAAFYEHFAMSDADALVFRDRHAADDLRWWAELTGDRIAYWAATPHTAAARHLRIDIPPDPPMRFASTGSYLRRWYGSRYLSIGFTLDHGSVSLGGGQVAMLPPPPADWFEHALGAVPHAQFAIDLRQPAPPAVRRWLHQRLVTRGLPDHGPASTIHADPPVDCFDVIVHRRLVSAATSL
jgi:erythromycin esterase